MKPRVMAQAGADVFVVAAAPLHRSGKIATLSLLRSVISLCSLLAVSVLRSAERLLPPMKSMGIVFGVRMSDDVVTLTVESVKKAAVTKRLSDPQKVWSRRLRPEKLHHQGHCHLHFWVCRFIFSCCSTLSVSIRLTIPGVRWWYSAVVTSPVFWSGTIEGSWSPCVAMQLSFTKVQKSS